MKSKAAVLFGGQGTQYRGMGRFYYEHYPECRQLFQSASEAVGMDVASLCIDASEDELLQPSLCQISVLAVDLCAGIAASKAVPISAAAGFSLGEYAALATAGVLGTMDVFRLVQIRGQLIEHSISLPGDYGMLTVLDLPVAQGLDFIKAMQSGFAQISIEGSPRQFTISGNTEGLREFRKLASQKRVRTVSLNVNVPYHCALMQQVAQDFYKVASSFHWSFPNIPLYLNSTGLRFRDEEALPALVAKQLCIPVQWRKTMESMAADGTVFYIECSPKPILARMVKDTIDGAQVCVSPNVNQ